MRHQLNRSSQDVNLNVPRQFGSQPFTTLTKRCDIESFLLSGSLYDSERNRLRCLSQTRARATRQGLNVPLR